MNKPSRYYITKSNTGFNASDLLCDNGSFLPFYSACGKKDDTSTYKTLAGAVKRLKKISRRYPEACVMHLGDDDKPVYLTIC